MSPWTVVAPLQASEAIAYVILVVDEYTPVISGLHNDIEEMRRLTEACNAQN